MCVALSPRSLQIKVKPVRLHGFQMPPHPLQGVTIIVFLFDFATFYAVLVPCLAFMKALAIIFGTLYALTSTGVIVYWWKATKSNPTDPTVSLQKKIEALGKRFDGSKFEFMCEICATHVLSTSKHCGACNRCVNSFDHHCRWINNCVGQANYLFFFKLIIFTFLMAVLHLSASGIVLAGLYQSDSDLSKAHENLFNDGHSTLPLVYAATAVNVLIAAALGHLIYFHVKLQRLDITTFDYIKR